MLLSAVVDKLRGEEHMGWLPTFQLCDSKLEASAGAIIETDIARLNSERPVLEFQNPFLSKSHITDTMWQ